MWQRHKLFWFQKVYIYNVLMGLVFLAVAFFVSHYANNYTTSHASNYVTDIILDNIPVVDVHLIFSEGAILFILILSTILLYEPKYIPFALKSIAVFILIRSFFVVLTHLAPPFQQIHINPSDYIVRLDSAEDLFFSGHTGLPFLMALVFWDQKWMRYFFFLCSAIGGTAVLLGHLHYSIDVFSALFISFGIFHICKHLFAKDFRLLKQGNP